jgi:ubiquinone/menaquinone biosynthesis C-methylase UbiE
MPVYDGFARVYDEMGHDRFSIRMHRYTQKILKQLRFRPGSVLDLACGTGSAAMLWGMAGLKVCGIDGSRQMLAKAQAKAKKEKLAIEFLQKPLTSFSVRTPVDLITCYFDSLNYLTKPGDLEAAFRRAYRALAPGGYFIFDMNTPEAMRVIWGSQIYGNVTGDLAWIWRNCYFPKARLAEVHATFFVRKGKRWERFDELHAERGYTNREIRGALKSAGFASIQMYDCFTFNRPQAKSMRVAVVAQRGN